MKHKAGTVDLSATNRKLIFFNIIIIGISLVCIFTLGFANFWKLSVKLQLSGSQIKNLYPNDSGTLNLDDVDIDIEIPIVITATGLQKAVQAKKDPAKVQAVIAPAIDAMHAQAQKLVPQMLTVGVKIAIDAAANALKTTSGEVEEGETPPETSDNAMSRAVEKIDTAGLADVFAEIFSGTVKEDEATAKIAAFLKGQVDKVSDLTPEEKAQAKEEIEKNTSTQFKSLFDYAADDEGYIKSEALINKLIGGIAGGGESFDPDKMIDEFSAKLADNKVIVIVINVLIALWLIPLIAWALLAVFALLHIFLKQKGASLTLVRTVGWFPGVNLWILPSIFLTLLPKMVAKWAPDQSVYLGSMKIAISAPGPAVSFFGTIALMVISMFGYRKSRKVAKRST